jgi:hypothetical protein
VRWAGAIVALAGCDLVLGLTPAPDATPGDDATDAVDRSCLEDLFDATSIDDTTWVVMDPAGPHVVSANGFELEIELEPFVPNFSYNGIQSIDRYDMTDATATVMLVRASNQVGWSEEAMDLVVAPQERYLISVGAGSINFGSQIDGVLDVQTISFGDGSLFRHWRIRHTSASSTMHLESSDNGAAWIERHAVPAGNVTAVTARLFAGTYQGGMTDVGLVRFDDFRLKHPMCP